MLKTNTLPSLAAIPFEINTMGLNHYRLFPRIRSHSRQRPKIKSIPIGGIKAF
jgi:hypothetical protein